MSDHVEQYKSLLEEVQKYLPLMLIVGVGLFSYVFSLNNEFLFDDKPYILKNTAIQKIANFDNIFAFLPNPTRFVPFYSFAINYFLRFKISNFTR